MTTLFQNLKNQSDLTSVLEIFEQALKYNGINCCRIGIVDEYDETTRVAKVTIANKLTLKQNADGSLVTQNYAPIYAKVLFFGWHDIGITHPVVVGSEGILLFNDREIESWYINGNINNLAYERAHDKTDAIFISGVLSLPNMIQTLQDCIHIFYKTKNIKVHENGITINGDTVINGNLHVNGNVTVTGDVIASGISLVTHKHIGVQGGSGTTGEPI
jgi:hypothetical protein